MHSDNADVTCQAKTEDFLYKGICDGVVTGIVTGPM